MLLFSGSFQLERMIPEGNATRLSWQECNAQERERERKRDREREGQEKETGGPDRRPRQPDNPYTNLPFSPKLLGFCAETTEGGVPNGPAFGAQKCTLSAPVARVQSTRLLDRH